ncbi:CFI-box-CTERM domain-containing protein [Gracilimonas sp. Q87]|uniref:CFI-box-CTERM domain-containing protein n=1 Tax=Gracilimonas sp. Q87 TaxID=3384766 RepID=UPI003984285E
MESNARKALNTHKVFLTKSRKLVGKEHEKFFVLSLRAAENFCKILEPKLDEHNFGLSTAELMELSQEQFNNLYKLLLSYFSIILTEQSISGSRHERISLARSIVGNEYVDILKNNIDYRSDFKKFLTTTTDTATDQVIVILKITNPDKEQIEQALVYMAYEYIRPSLNKLGKNKFCYVATDIYQDQDHPKVVLLRKFRDEYLITNKVGRYFVAKYYENSPKLISNKFYILAMRKPTKYILDVLTLILRKRI